MSSIDLELNKIISDHLKNLWEGLMDDCSEIRNLEFKAVLDAFLVVALISTEQHELWIHLIRTCPDPNHIRGRNWCAYCGDIESKDECTNMIWTLKESDS